METLIPLIAAVIILAALSVGESSARARRCSSAVARPKRSASTRVSESAAQLTATNCPAARGLARWTWRAASSFTCRLVVSEVMKEP